MFPSGVYKLWFTETVLFYQTSSVKVMYVSITNGTPQRICLYVYATISSFVDYVWVDLLLFQVYCMAVWSRSVGAMVDFKPIHCSFVRCVCVHCMCALCNVCVHFWSCVCLCAWMHKGIRMTKNVGSPLGHKSWFLGHVRDGMYVARKIWTLCVHIWPFSTSTVMMLCWFSCVMSLCAFPPSGSSVPIVHFGLWPSPSGQDFVPN